MSKIQTFLKKQKELEKLRAELEKMESSEALKREFEFKDKLDKLLSDFKKSPVDAINALKEIDPSFQQRASNGKTRTRPLMIYRNPHTDEVIKTRGGNTKTLNQWREKYGKDTVDAWKQKA